MNLRFKTLAIVGSSILAMVLILWLISRAFWMHGYYRLEEGLARQNVTRAIGVLHNWLDSLNRVTGDWAAWDDTYAFVQDHNSDYIDANLVNGTFTELDLNFIVFADSQGQIAAGYAFDLGAKKRMPLPEDLEDYLHKNPDLLRLTDPETAITGIILPGTGKDSIMISSRPILTSEDQGPIRGALLMGRYLSVNRLNELSRLLDLQIQISFLPDSPPEMLQRLASAKQDGKAPILVQPNGRNSLTGFTLMEDVRHRPALILSVLIPRDISLKGEANLAYYLASMVLLAVACIVSTLFLLEKSILARIAFLNTWVNRVEDSRNLPPFPLFAGADELVVLAEAIKGSFLRLQRAEAISRQNQERYQMLVELSPEVIFTLTGEDGEIGSLNDSFEEITGWSSKDFIGRPFTSLLHPEDVPMANEMFHRAMSGEKIHPFEIRVFIRSGEIRIGEVVAVPEIRNGNVVSILGFARDISERKEAELGLLESEQKLRQLSTLLLNAQENERTRISKELHDELGQSLTVLKFRIRGVEKKLSGNPAIQAECLQTRRSIDEIIENVRRLSRDLRPSVLEDLGLWGSLQWLVQNTAQHYQIESRVDMVNIDRFFSPESQILIFRIFQEALANIGKHAQASRIYFSVVSSGGRIQMTMRDDGVGFDRVNAHQFTSVPKGLGLAAMHERARILGGDLEIRSKKGEGTEVALMV